MARSDQDITLDEKSQEQPQTQKRARDPSSKDRPQPPTREEEKTGKVAGPEAPKAPKAPGQ